MKKYLETKKIFLGIVLVELLIFVWGYFSEPNINEAIRISARYSARFSAIMYLLTLNFFIFQANNEIEKRNLSRFMLAFAVVHFIHFIFLAYNVFLNNIELIPYKLAGGFLAYLMILLFPFFVNKPWLSKWSYYVYFYYVGIVFIITYLSRIKGQFEGASPSIFHHFGLIAVSVSFILCPLVLYKKGRIKKNKLR